HKPAAGTKRQTFDMTALIDSCGRAKVGGERFRRFFADGLSRDKARCRNILIEKGRRNFQYVGNVVESRADIVCGEQSGSVNAQGEDVFDRIGVFGAIKPMHCDKSWIRIRRGSLIKRSLQP